MKENLNLSKAVHDKQLQEQLASAEIRLYEKFDKLDLESLPISEYNRRYLGTKIPNLKGLLSLYGRLLYLSLQNSQKSLKKSVLVDYGGGSGVISLLAIELGVGTVIYNDIYDVSCCDVGILCNALDLNMDHIVCGDVDELVSYLQEKSISINAIVSYDVLEHIYDVEAHFQRLNRLTGSVFRIVYASGANIENPLYVRSVKQKQLKAEYQTREKKWGHKERDSLQAYLDIRKNIISSYAPGLAPDTVDHLARSTRGLIQSDIEKRVDEFRNNGCIQYHIDHPTNTCDPYTGNWCEHLMEFEWLERTIRDRGFSVEILTGRYTSGGSLLKRSVKKILNSMLQIMGRRGMIIAPYFVVYGASAKKGAHPDEFVSARSQSG
jgi:hypothetical protein